MKITHKFSHQLRNVKNYIGHHGNFFIGVLIIHFVFFGLICNSSLYNVQPNIVWVLTRYGFQTYFGLPILVLFLTCFVVSYKHHIPYYGLKYSFWYAIITVLLSYVWFGFNFGFRTGDALRLTFFHVEGYLNFVLLLVVNLSGSALGIYMKLRYLKKKKSPELPILLAITRYREGPMQIAMEQPIEQPIDHPMEHLMDEPPQLTRDD